MNRLRTVGRTVLEEPRCPYCIGVETVAFDEFLDLNEHWKLVRVIRRTITQRTHDKACPAQSAPLGTALAPLDMTAEIIADARRQRRALHERV